MTGNRPVPAPLLVDARTAARMLSMSQRTLWSLTEPRGTIPMIRVGDRRMLRYAVRDLEAWIDSNRQGGQADGE